MAVLLGYLLHFFQNLDVLVVLQHEARGLPQGIGGQFPDAQSIQSRRPVQGLGDGGLLQNGFAGPELLHRQGHLGAEPVIHMGKLRPENGQFLLHVGIFDVQVGAAPPEGFA